MYGKVYFGQHTTENLDDGYIASGKKILNYLNKYPGEYYREIINFYSSEEELNKEEYDLIHPHLNKDYCLNLVEGGNHHSPSIELRNQISEKLKGVSKSEEFKQNLRELYKGRQFAVQTEECKKNISKAKKNKPSSFKNKKHTDKAKELNRLAHINRHRVYDNEEHTKYHYELNT